MAKGKKDRKADKAIKYIADGKFSKARTLLEKILEARTQDYRLWLRLGDVCRKLDDADGAVAAYRKAARGFAQEGFLVQAIACHKQVLELKPEDESIHESLSELYEQRGLTYVRPGEERLIVSSPRTSDTAPPPEPEAPAVAPPDPHEIELEPDEPAPARAAEAAGEDAGPVAAPPAGAADEELVPEIWTEPQPGEAHRDEPPADLQIEADDEIAAAVAEGEGADEIAAAIAESAAAIDGTGQSPAAPAAVSAPVALPPVPLLADLKPAEMQVLIESLERTVRSTGEVICQEGEPGDSLFLISRGRVGIYGRTPAGEQELLAELGEGEFFGEFALFSTHRRQATVETLEETELLEVSQETFQRLVDLHPRVREVALEYYRTRITANLDRRCALFRALPPEARARVLEFGESKVFLEGSPVLREGMRGEALYVIADGELEVRVDFGEDSLHMGRLGPGEFFGEISALTGNPCTADVFALSRVEVVAFERERALELVEVFPEIREILESFRERRVHRTLDLLEEALDGEGTGGREDT